jgi:hypothetical protein
MDASPLLGSNATRLTTLDPNASYLTAIVLPNVVDQHSSLDSREKEFDMEDVMKRHDFTGLPARLNHNDVWRDVGWVDGYRPGKNTEVLIRLEPSDDVESLFASNALANGYYRGVSLGHEYTTSVSSSVCGGLDVRKEGVEISLCSQGRRDGSVISQFFPSLGILLTQDRVGLERFASIYRYPEPPAIGDEFQHASDVPELRAYVERALYPTVARRRNDLLKSAGYIAASRHHKPNSNGGSGKVTMSSTPATASDSTATNLDPSSGKTTIQAQPATTTTMAAPSTTAPGGGGGGVPGASSTSQHTSTAIDANDPVAVMKALTAELAWYKNKDATEAAERQAAEKAARDKKESEEKTRDDSERAEKHAWLKTAHDLLVRAGAEDTAEETKMFQDLTAKLTSAPTTKAFNEQYGTLAEMAVKAAKKSYDSYEAQMQAQKKLQERELQMAAANAARQLGRSKIGSASMSGSFPMSRDPDADVDDKPRAKKRGADYTADELRSGTVEASRNARGAAEEELITPKTRGWGLKVAMRCVQHNPDGTIVIPSYDEIACGGKVFKGKVQAGPGGKTVQVLEDRFDEPRAFGPQDMFPDFYDAMVEKLPDYRPSREQMREMRTLGARLDPIIARF